MAKIYYKELIKTISDSVKIYEYTREGDDPSYNVEINGSPNVIKHLNYMEALEETRGII